MESVWVSFLLSVVNPNSCIRDSAVQVNSVDFVAEHEENSISSIFPNFVSLRQLS